MMRNKMKIESSNIEVIFFTLMRIFFFFFFREEGQASEWNIFYIISHKDSLVILGIFAVSIFAVDIFATSIFAI